MTGNVHSRRRQHARSGGPIQGRFHKSAGFLDEKAHLFGCTSWALALAATSSVCDGEARNLCCLAIGQPHVSRCRNEENESHEQYESLSTAGLSLPDSTNAGVHQCTRHAIFFHRSWKTCGCIPSHVEVGTCGILANIPHSGRLGHQIEILFGYLAFPPGAVRTPPAVCGREKHRHGAAACKRHQTTAEWLACRGLTRIPRVFVWYFPFRGCFNVTQAVSQRPFLGEVGLLWQRLNVAPCGNTHGTPGVSFHTGGSIQQATSVWLPPQINANMMLVTSCVDRGYCGDESKLGR
ncbi:hypothetical protein QBC36DRAFT_95321 [Triangularia setosa]|uniref:Uncharacterized protein n=1 Tax=Triangularia setosa TaxID=2587417 RepID=A0AAN6VX43_9PEZI|nr:hypothetical protein QBC36DRAFT_95321 [Podospora setosa]